MQFSFWPFKNNSQRIPTIWNCWEHRGWGNNIYFHGEHFSNFHGHLTPGPSVGDFLRIKAENGRLCDFEIKSIELIYDPPDMFFGTVGKGRLV